MRNKIDQKPLQLKNSERLLLKSQDELSIKNQIFNIFLTVTYEEIYNQILQVVLKVLKSQFGVVGYMNEQEDVIYPSLTRDVWDICKMDNKDSVFPKKIWSKTVFGEVINKKKSLIVNKPLNVPEGHVPLLNFLGSPIIHHDKIIGLIAVANKVLNYNEDDLKILDWITSIIAPILYESLQKQKYEEELKTQNLELEKLNDLKSEFLKNASHELKTPLISIKGFSNLLQLLYNDVLDKKAVSMLKEIEQSCSRLEKIIKNLIVSSRLESSKVEFNTSKENLSSLIKHSIMELQTLAKLRNQTINAKLDDQVITKLNKEQILEVFANLISNAIKYTPKNGEINILTEIRGKNVVISIVDNGIGFTQDEKEKIFKEFGKIVRDEQNLDLEIEGTGLGLYISKKIISLHGGEIWMESEGKNKGTTFFISLPIIIDEKENS